MTPDTPARTIAKTRGLIAAANDSLATAHDILAAAARYLDHMEQQLEDQQ